MGEDCVDTHIDLHWRRIVLCLAILFMNCVVRLDSDLLECAPRSPDPKLDDSIIAYVTESECKHNNEQCTDKYPFHSYSRRNKYTYQTAKHLADVILTVTCTNFYKL